MTIGSRWPQRKKLVGKFLSVSRVFLCYKCDLAIEQHFWNILLKNYFLDKFDSAFCVKSCLNTKLIEIQKIQDCPPNATQRKMVLNFAESDVGNIGEGSRGIVWPNIGGTILEIFAQFGEYSHNSDNIRTIQGISANPVAIWNNHQQPSASATWVTVTNQPFIESCLTCT